jgi:hypothetical protein
MPFHSSFRDRMTASRIVVEFRARVVPEPENAWPFSLTSLPGVVVVRGQVSAGHSGWVLAASAMRRRRRVTLQIAARPRTATIIPDIEQHEYEAVISGLSGEHDIFVNHIFYAEGYATSLPEPRFLGRVVLAVPLLLPLLMDVGERLVLAMA